MQQAILPARAPIHAHIVIPGAKSITYRALLLAALADGVSEITNIHIDEPLKIFANALTQLGIVIQLDETTSSCIIAGGSGHFPKKQANIWCDNETIIARFLLAAAAASPGVYYFDGAETLRKRHIERLVSILERQGAQVLPSNATSLPFTLVGSESLEGGEIIFDKKAHTQLISAMLMVAPFARSVFEFNIPQVADHRYIDMTIAMMAEFGVLVHRIHQGQYMVPVPQRYHARDYALEPDFSLAAYFFAAAAVTEGEISITANKRIYAKHAAVKFLSILEKMGCVIHENENTLRVKGPKTLQGIEINIRDSIDSLFALAAIAPYAATPTRISYVGLTREKHLDRIAHLITELKNRGVQLKASKNTLEIFPSKPTGGIVTSYGDYRMAYAFAILGLKTPGIVIDDVDAAHKHFPTFFQLWHRLAEGMNISA